MLGRGGGGGGRGGEGRGGEGRGREGGRPSGQKRHMGGGGGGWRGGGGGREGKGREGKGTRKKRVCLSGIKGILGFFVTGTSSYHKHGPMCKGHIILNRSYISFWSPWFVNAR